MLLCQPYPLKFLLRARLWRAARVLFHPPRRGTMPARRGGGRELRVHGITCAACPADFTRLSSWSGQAGGPRYCHRRPCQSQGKAAGHIRERTATKRKRRAATGAAEQGSDSSDGELPASLDLVELHEICQMRYITPKLLRRAPQRWNAVACENKKLELLVYGKFTLNDEDINGQMAYHWLSKSILLEKMGFEEAAIDQAVEVRSTWPTFKTFTTRHSRRGVPS